MAVFLSSVPAGPLGGFATVPTAGTAWLMLTDSAAHSVAAGLFLPSPLYLTVHQ
jgi:hypothetical protein